jgi:hypothetical protein
MWVVFLILLTGSFPWFHHMLLSPCHPHFPSVHDISRLVFCHNVHVTLQQLVSRHQTVLSTELHFVRFASLGGIYILPLCHITRLKDVTDLLYIERVEVGTL